MGNCMKASRSRQLEEDEIEKTGEEAAVKTEFDEKEKGVGKSSIKVKIVLTKEELELFLVKLKNNNNGGGKTLEDLLAEMEKARSGKLHSTWRPSLESIMEDDPEEPEKDFEFMN